MMTMFDIERSREIIMSIDDAKSVTQQRKPRRRKFYDMSFDYSMGGMPGYSLDNLGQVTLRPPSGQRGFPKYPEAPRILFDKDAGRLPPDLEQFHAYWLVSDRTKSVLQAVDPTGFIFVACKVRIPGGDYDGPDYWLCDVIRVLDALDETQSRLKISRRGETGYLYSGEKHYSLAGGAELVFKDDIIGNMHVFRMAYQEPTVICDQVLKDACKAAGLKGIKFRDASKL